MTQIQIADVITEDNAKVKLACDDKMSDAEILQQATNAYGVKMARVATRVNIGEPIPERETK